MRSCEISTYDVRCLHTAALSYILSMLEYIPLLQVLTTTPMVPYRLLQAGGKYVDLESPLDFPKDKSFEDVEEPTVECTILVPDAYTGAVLQLCAARRGELLVSCTPHVALRISAATAHTALSIWITSFRHRECWLHAGTFLPLSGSVCC